MKKTLTNALLGLSLVLTFGAFQPAHAEFFPDYRLSAPTVSAPQAAEPSTDAQQQSGSNDTHVTPAPTKSAPASAASYAPDSNWTAPLDQDNYHPMR